MSTIASAINIVIVATVPHTVDGIDVALQCERVQVSANIPSFIDTDTSTHG